jgi:hypothetical protein
MAISEAATGFYGGPARDELPGMSLDEATSYFPVVIMESQMEFQDTVAANNQAMVESVTNAIRYGSSYDAQALTEGAFDTLVTKIKAFFDKLHKWVSSIIAKLKVYIDKVRMNGAQMKSKYHGSKMLNKSFEGLIINGYDFKKANTKATFKNMDNYTGDIQGLLMTAVKKIDPNFSSPKDFENANRSKMVAGDASVKAAYEDEKSKIKKVKDLSSSKRKFEMAKLLVDGISGKTDDSWYEYLNKTIYGDKVDLKAGKDFTLDDVESALDGVDLKEIQDQYERMRSAIASDKDELTRHVDEFKDWRENDSTATEDERAKRSRADTDEGKYPALVNEYYEVYMSLYSDATAVVNSIEDVHMKFEKQKINQAKTIYAKMLTYKKKDTTKDDAADMFDIVELESEF